MSDLNLSTLRKWKLGKDPITGLVGKETIGELYVNGSHFAYTLEDMVREVKGQPVESWKVQNVTAIPSGRFEVKMTYSVRFKKIMPELQAVPGFTGVRAHGGNTDADTDGCILVGEMKDNEGIHNCAAVLEKLAAIIEATIRANGRVYWSVVNAFEAAQGAAGK